MFLHLIRIIHIIWNLSFNQKRLDSNFRALFSSFSPSLFITFPSFQSFNQILILLFFFLSLTQESSSSSSSKWSWTLLPFIIINITHSISVPVDLVFSSFILSSLLPLHHHHTQQVSPLPLIHFFPSSSHSSALSLSLSLLSSTLIPQNVVILFIASLLFPRNHHHQHHPPNNSLINSQTRDKQEGRNLLLFQRVFLLSSEEGKQQVRRVMLEERHSINGRSSFSLYPPSFAREKRERERKRGMIASEWVTITFVAEAAPFPE